jgi:hypothetical protein
MEICMKSQKDITNEIIDEAMSQIISGVNTNNVLCILLGQYQNVSLSKMKSLVNIAHEDAMNYKNDMENMSYE